MAGQESPSDRTPLVTLARDAAREEPAPSVAALGFVLLMVFLGYLGWDGNPELPDLTKMASGLIAALLGAVINPGRGLPKEVWTALGWVALLAAVSAGLALLAYPGNKDGVVALTSAVAAFAGLFVDASKVSHTGSDDSAQR